MSFQSASAGCAPLSQVPRIALVAAAMLYALTNWDIVCTASDQASIIVQSALRSEVRLDSDQRTRLIEAALKEDPNLAAAHWARGEVLVRGQWISLEDLAAEVIRSSSLQKYEERRGLADNTARGQARLAEYCRANHLPAQARAHWNAVIARDPHHAEARRRLGQVNVGGAWIEKRQLAAQKKNEQDTIAYLQKHSGRLVELSVALQEKSRSIDAIVKELGQFRSPLVIPGLEYLFSRSGESGGRCTVESVASLPSPEASLSLARHALDFPDESVRDRATSFLKGRDELTFVPALLDLLQTPAMKQDGFVVNSGSQVVWRRRVLFETQNTKQLATFDRVFQFPAMVRGRSPVNQEAFVNQMVANSDFALENYNAEVDSKNERVMQLLAKITDDQTQQIDATRAKLTPEDWWSWWENRIESYPADDKSVVARYEMDYTQIPPPPPLPRAQYECLAAGTPIWTERGAVAVEQVKVGDLILTQNPRSGELKFAAAIATSTRPPERLRRIKINDEIVRATGGHPFWVVGKGWVKTRALQPGMGLHTARGLVVIESIEDEEEPAETHNLIVDECHSYFVGNALILSHDNSARQPVTNRVPGLREDGVVISRAN